MMIRNNDNDDKDEEKRENITSLLTDSINGNPSN